MNELFQDVLAELQRAEAKFPPFNSSHEGYAVILEELDGLWDDIKNNKRPDTLSRQRAEAVQVAAMGLRFISMIDGKMPPAEPPASTVFDPEPEAVNQLDDELAKTKKGWDSARDTCAKLRIDLKHEHELFLQAAREREYWQEIATKRALCQHTTLTQNAPMRDDGRAQYQCRECGWITRKNVPGVDGTKPEPG